ncbi:uncharacterized protein [Zea mays]|uniref:Uncharacterized protein n=1 Tax=Zea mays TaxID=4577 RepID=C4J3L0_MAIZE|nr:uncharacterized protein LOC109943420 [Zea mays]ACR35760.1 unknown [Zea mays]|eukprot:XP_020401966.1 uncharacterized protein LOC109943420 [Zea mays]
MCLCTHRESPTSRADATKSHILVMVAHAEILLSATRHRFELELGPIPRLGAWTKQESPGTRL